MGSSSESLFLLTWSWKMLIKHLNVQITYRLNNWRNGFGTKAAEALKRYIKVDQAKYFENKQVIADWVQFYLTPGGNPPTYPFLWKEWKINDDTGKITKRYVWVIVHGNAC